MAAVGASGQRSARVGMSAALNKAHENLLEAIYLVAHADHVDPKARETREDLVQVLLLRHLDLAGYAVTLVDDRTLEIEVSKEQNLEEIFMRLVEGRAHPHTGAALPASAHGGHP